MALTYDTNYDPYANDLAYQEGPYQQTTAWTAGLPPPPEGTQTTDAAVAADPLAVFFDADGKFKGDYQGYFNAIFPGETLTGADLLAKKDLLAKAGMNVVTSASGNTAWVNWPGSGGDWDVIGDYGGANRKTWQAPGTGSGAPGTTATTSPALTAAQLAAQRALVEYPNFEPPDFNAPEFNKPAPFEYPDYAGPTADEAAAEPGYEFGRKEALRALTNASSAEGLLRTGGTLKEFMNYGQGLAGQQFRDVDARKRATWEGNRFNQADIYDRDYRNAITENMLGYNREADKYNRSLSTYGTNLGTAGARAGISSDMQDNQWSRLLSLYDISTRNLPKYTPTAPSISPSGFTG